MKIPPKINIGGIIYDVKLVSGKVNNVLQEASFRGMYSNEKCIITIDKNANKQVIEQTFFHEVLHGIESNFKLKFSENNIDRLARGIYQVLNDNNLLLKD
ncbi:MAG: hypothetical protein ACYDIA_01745 [Candidatus Humimicrobiaceae bacterium]